MKFVCDGCKTKYSIADEKVRGKILKIRCKECNTTITVREPSPSEAAASHPDANPPEARALDRALEAALAAPALASPSVDLAPKPAQASDTIPPGGSQAAAHTSPSAPSRKREPRPSTSMKSIPKGPPARALTEEWYLAANGQQFGPMSLPELQARLRRSEAGEDDHVWTDGFESWMTIRDVPELCAHFHPKPPPLPQDMALPRAPTPSVNLAMLTPWPPSAGALNMPAGEDVGMFRPATGQMQTPIAAGTPVSITGGYGLSPQEAGPAAIPTNTATAHTNPGFVPTAWVAPQPQSPPWLKAGVVIASLVAVTVLALAIVVLARGPALPEVQSPQTVAVAPAAAPLPAPIASAPPAPGPSKEATPETTDPKAAPTARTGSAGKTTRPGVATPLPSSATLTEEQKRLAELYGSGQEVAPNVATSGSASPIKKNVTSGDIDRVRLANQNALKICYERAAKRDPALKSIRIDVEVDVASGGHVSRVGLSSQSGTQLGDCLSQSVRRWSFPNTGEDYSVGFPIIFQGG